MEPFVVPLRLVLVFVVVLARVGGMMTFAPVWSHRAASKQARVLLAFAVSFALTPALASSVPEPPTNAVALMLVIAGELFVGFALGYVGRLAFASLEIAAKLFGDAVGFSLAATIDPSTRAQTAALATITQMIGLMILLAADGHHWLLTAAARSYAVTAPGDPALSPALLDLVLRLSADLLAVGLGLAAPAIVVLLAIEVALAIVDRAAPGLQLMAASFSLKIAAGLWLLGASLYFIPGAIRTALAPLRPALARALGAM